MNLGWFRFRPQAAVDKKVLDDLVESLTLSKANMRGSWWPILGCLLRGGTIVFYSERKFGARVTRVNLEINPAGAEKRKYEIHEGSRCRNGRIIRMNSEKNSEFKYFFRIATISLVKNQPEDLSWDVGILQAQEVPTIDYGSVLHTQICQPLKPTSGFDGLPGIRTGESTKAYEALSANRGIEIQCRSGSNTV